jgi:dephospho-CoA kinase
VAINKRYHHIALFCFYPSPQKIIHLSGNYGKDIPLFFENSAYPIKNSVTVYAPKEIQLQRFIKRDGFDKTEALRRIESQMDIEEKKRRSTWVIDNSKDLKHLQAECEDFVEKIKEQF